MMMFRQCLLMPLLAIMLSRDGRLEAQSTVGPYLQIVGQSENRLSYLGVNLLDVDADRAGRLRIPEEQGVEVISVEEGTPAEAAGIKQGDVLLSYNGEIILGTQQFSRLVRETPPGRKVKLQIWRDGKSQYVTAIIGALQPRPIAIPTTSAGFRSLESSGLRTLNVPDVLMTWTNLALKIKYEPLDTQLAQYFGVSRGILVRDVGRNGLGEKAGLKAGDVLTAIDNKSLTSPEDLGRAVHASSKPLSVSLVRDHKRLTLTLGSLDADQ